MDTERFDRQILLFGREGQEKIEQTRVAIVGLGGTGSHVVQQLAYLGVRTFGLIDADIVTASSRNRLVGSTPDDVEVRRLKVTVAERVIRSVDPTASVQCVPESFVSTEGVAALQEADVIFGCVDTDGARLLLTEWTSAYDRHYLDLATDTNPDGAFGGRLIVSVDGKGCLYCLGELDQNAIHIALAPPERRTEEDMMYGVRRNALDDRGPSVVSLNGIIASLAVMEFLVLVTGQFRPPKRLLHYRGNFGVVNEPMQNPDDGCPYCSQRGIGDRADWSRHIRNGLGQWVR